MELRLCDDQESVSGVASGLACRLRIQKFNKAEPGNKQQTIVRALDTTRAWDLLAAAVPTHPKHRDKDVRAGYLG